MRYQMKTFKEYLQESKKTYQWKVGVAGDLPEGFDDDIKSAMEKFNIVSFSKAKTTPVQECPLDFPKLENCSVTYYDVEVAYPSTDLVIQEYLGYATPAHAANIIVRNPASPLEIEKEQKEETEYTPLLNTEELDTSTSGQPMVAGNRVMDLLKELEAHRKESVDEQQTIKPEISVNTPETTDSQNQKSPIGS